MLLITLGIIISALGGFLLSYYISKHKHAEEKMVCPAGSSCGELVNGRFSRFLGIPVERAGMMYYGLIFLIYLAIIVRVVPDVVLTIGILLTGLGFIFSLYLAIVQIFVVKKWCTLCLGSLGISFIIIVLSFLGYEASFAEFAYTYRDLFKWIYIGFVFFGTLMTTLHARTFIKFLKDFEISRKEEKRLEMFSHSAWVAMGISFLTGLGLVLTDRWREFTDSNAFIVMVVIMVILIIYEVIMNMRVSPKLVGMHFGDHPKLDDDAHRFQRKIAFTAIAVGVVSWYSLLVLGIFNFFDYSSGQIFMMYLILLVLGILLTNFVEHILYKKSLHSQEVLD
jgi:uncharacterized membrane protein